MEYRKIGNSGLKVSGIGLGGNNFGWKVDGEAAISIIKHALDIGINFINTAEMYSYGRSEELVGKAVKGKRSEVIISKRTKPREKISDLLSISPSWICSGER